MLISLKFSNFRSFTEEATLSFVASAADRAMRSSLRSIPVGSREIALLPSLAIYGANAAGKSNVLLALEYIRDAIRLSHRTWSPNSGTHIPQSKTDHRAASRFQIELFVGGARYQYGFEANATAFQAEWLIGFTGSRSHTLFRRSTTDDGISKIKVGSRFEGAQKVAQSLESRLRPNSLFISLAAQENFSDALTISKWFDEDVNIPPLRLSADPIHASVTSELAFNHAPFKSKLVQIMKAADSSILDINVYSSEVSAERAQFVNSLPEGLKEIFEESSKYKVEFLLQGDERIITLPFNAQSKGVQKIYSMAGYVLSSIEHGELMVIDELEASMHPHLARTIVDMFQSPITNKRGAQLLFVTHDTNLLDQSLLRRDQVWFVEKDKCNSHLYSLLDFKPRKDEDLERGYLRGRYGAVPVASPNDGWLEAIDEGFDFDPEIH